MKFKKSQQVLVISTSYISEKYPSHIGGSAIIKEIIPQEDWLSDFSPEYKVIINKKEYIIPEYSMEAL